MADPYRNAIPPNRDARDLYGGPDTRSGLFGVEQRASLYGAEPPGAPYVADAQRTFSGYLPTNANPRASAEYLRNDLVPLRAGTYGLDEQLVGASGRSASVLNGLSGGRAVPPLEDPALVRREASLGVRPRITDQVNPVLEPELLENESNILFVDGLPTNCTRREVAHLFRPFIGFKDIRVVHKEPRKSGDKAYVLCFVEFSDSKCARTAIEALQGYLFDDRKPEAPPLKIGFARFPFRLPTIPDDAGPRRGSVH